MKQKQGVTLVKVLHMQGMRATVYVSAVWTEGMAPFTHRVSAHERTTTYRLSAASRRRIIDLAERWQEGSLHLAHPGNTGFRDGWMVKVVSVKEI